ncbi:MAG: HD domain-containing protein [Deltaproteobacteria bacterium]|nr:HD domain-containing protein [Deltaproteobacteria bacterium]
MLKNNRTEADQLKLLRVLIVEDNEDDALLIIRELKKTGYSPEYRQVETAAEMHKSLRENTWDIILCDYNLPKFSGIKAIELLKETKIDIPLIVVSGTIGEETAVECMKAGAHDYFMKGKLSRLGQAIERELKEAASRDKQRLAEKALRDSEEKYHGMIDFLPIAIFEIDTQGALISFNKFALELFGYGEKDYHKDMNALTFFAPEEERKFRKNLQKVIGGSSVPGQEYVFLRKDGSTFPGLIFASATTEGDNIAGIRGAIIDITERKQNFEKIRKALDATVRAMAATVETRDPYTAGHQYRVAHLAQAIAAEMNLDEEQIEGIRIAALIHDIGKIAVPAEILTKPGKLTPLEYNLVKTHAQSGYDILKDIEFPWPVAETVFQHHERLDGSGYPQGLESESIILQARILAVADVVESIASHRPYRPALGIEAAIEEIYKNRTILYDKDVVDACIGLIRNKGYELM